MNDIKISFTVSKMPFDAVSCKKSINIKAENNELKLAVRYDSHNEPLVLKGGARIGDKVFAVLMDHRIELYVNGALVDEEWPIGNRLLEQNEGFAPDRQIKIERYCPPSLQQPSILGVFSNAEGWKPEENVFVGDCMPYVRGDEYHVLYLKDRHHHYSKWGMGAHQWAHVSTRDFNEWFIHPMAVEITDPTEGSICTGSWIKHEETEYLYYTVRRGGAAAAPIRRSISADGYHFEKDESFGFVLPEKYNQAVARDPKVIRDENGLFHMLLTTALASEGKGCLAHFVSSDLTNWRDTEMPIYVSNDSTEPECPDYIVYKNSYYLIFSLNGKARYMLSSDPFDNWRSPKNPEIPCASVPKGAVWNGKIIFAGFKGINGYAGTITFKTATADENGELVFA
ncbi:MAG: hypothetical protein IJB49_05455 [Clostridia bacterium]|nr:hypothetical protein [Clostridia bacterium]